jgi:integrase
MSKRNAVPTYRLHKQSGQAIVTLPDGLGGRRDVLLGKHGTPESRLEYSRIIANWDANGRRSPPDHLKANDLLVNEVMILYMTHVEGYYRHPDGTQTSEVENIKKAFRQLRTLYGHTIAGEFDSRALEAVRGQMIRFGLCRNRINKDVARIKRMFKWAGAKKLISSSVWSDLQTLEGLRAGRTAAKETLPVLPVARSVVEATLSHLSPVVADMVSLQLETGMRPGEVVIMRAIDINLTGPIWLYYPCKHKNQHRGLERVVPIGPKAQEIVRRRLKTDMEAYLFSPRDSIAMFRARQRRDRKTPVQPSQRDRKKRKPSRQPGSRYTVSSYDTAIAEACKRAFPPPAHLGPRDGETKKAWMARVSDAEKEALRAWWKAHCWHPHRLRHLRALELKREVGLDAARAVLGHKCPAITEHYATLDIAKASEVMLKLG